jgi:drug/metabolite transporter (DMT)-like permease
MNSMLAYSLNTWAVRHAPPSVVTNFCVLVLQPVVAIALSLVLLSMDHYHYSSLALEGLAFRDLGVLAVAAGLLLLCTDEWKRLRKQWQQRRQ